MADWLESTVIHVIAANYEYAQSMLAAGLWRVDPGLGLVYGVKGRPFIRTNSWGYIQIKYRLPEHRRMERAVLAHRVIWESEHGTILGDLQINHLNGVKTDNRLANLELVTPSANLRHAIDSGLKPPGHGGSRLTEEQALEIYRRCWRGERDAQLGKEYGLNRSTVNNIRNGWNWTSVTGHQPIAR